jgi:excisionase family DNA binding protein
MFVHSKNESQMKNSTLLHDLTPEEIFDLFKGLKNQIEELKKDIQPKFPDEYITRTELAELLKCDLSTIHNWTKKGKLTAYGIGNRVYYKRSEVEAVLIPLNNKDI